MALSPQGNVRGRQRARLVVVSRCRPWWEDSGGTAGIGGRRPRAPSMVHQCVKLPARQDSKRIRLAPRGMFVRAR